MDISLRRRHLMQATAALATLGGAAARAQTYPSRPVKLVVGSPPGGPSDFLGRLMGEQLGQALGQSFVVENKPGASGMPAADLVAKSAPDGHTLLVSGPASIAVAPHLAARLAYDPINDLTPVCMLGAGAFVLVVHPGVNVRTVPELIALARSKPGQLSYGSGGNGSSGHLCTESFSMATGTRMLHIPYKGDGQAVTDLLAGQFQVLFTAPNVAMPHVKSGKLRLLAVTTRERVTSMPDVPTVHETVRDFEYLGWIIVFAQAAAPRQVFDTLATAWNKARITPLVRDKLETLAMSAPERLSQRPALLEFVKTEHARLGKLIRDAGIKSDT